ncbi:uncharacterized protein LOC132188830 isoform X1 [Corylus avellana]|uniref:uncharacterized protein LOC132188830 isoform X1 n=1 Tax=Corylus avellana TaxID=13451 RepID=UPI00286ADD41|nr:uncharacterized protein LOC132188830 isoform X1 [Corylus avellana]XP_059459373.1 uncharacterized protein LOC132188830 isoform X1 [Corylus avellana]XP_059459374.1 uncharacterized protein LOC132188830 isoform X1 [Corylus avellana]
MVKVVVRKKKEKRGHPPLSDLGDPPLEEKQQRKRTRRASVLAPLRRSRRLNPNLDADKIRRGKPEKRARIHPKKEEKQVRSYDFYADMGNWHDITDEEFARYVEHVSKSDGFDVPLMLGVIACGLIQPRNVNTLVEARKFILYSNLAIEEYNTWIRTHKPESPQVKFRKVVKAMSQACDVVRYYITFVAKEVAAGGQTKTYQAVVRCRIPVDVNITVLSFRECEQVEGSGIIRGKEWIWEGHTGLWEDGCLYAGDRDRVV